MGCDLGCGRVHRDRARRVRGAGRQRLAPAGIPCARHRGGDRGGSPARAWRALDTSALARRRIRARLRRGGARADGPVRASRADQCARWGRATAHRALLPVLRADRGAAVALALAGGRGDPRRTARRRKLAHRKTGRGGVSGRSPLRGRRTRPRPECCPARRTRDTRPSRRSRGRDARCPGPRSACRSTDRSRRSPERLS